MLQNNQEVIKSKILYAQAVYGDEEKQAVLKSMENGWLAAGPLVKEFEEKIAALFGKKYGIAVNSGSSANLIAIKALNFKEGSEIITPACTFATTVSEVINNGLVPVFVDSVVGRYTIDEELIEQAITNKTAAILVPQLIGGVSDMRKLKELADKYLIRLIDDSCDTLAPSINNKSLASFADVTTTSFYGSHIITALGMGGMILTDNEFIRDRAINLKDWGRVGNDKEAFENRFNFKVDNIPYDSKFIYSQLGYNLKMNESAAAFGLEQLKKLPQFRDLRKHNFARLVQIFSQYIDFFYLPELLLGGDTNWLAFPLTIKEDVSFTRYNFLKHLESNRIQVRVLFSGNITRHPIYKDNSSKWRTASKLDSADLIMANGFLIGCHQGMTDEDIDYIQKVVERFFNENIINWG